MTALAMSATLASAQGASRSVEERLRQLEAEQAAMKQQLAERDAVIQELKRELAVTRWRDRECRRTTSAVRQRPRGRRCRHRRLPPGRRRSCRLPARGAHAADGRDLGRLRPG